MPTDSVAIRGLSPNAVFWNVMLFGFPLGYFALRKNILAVSVQSPLSMADGKGGPLFFLL